MFVAYFTALNDNMVDHGTVDPTRNLSLQMVHMVHTPVWLIIAAIKLAWLGSMGIEHFYLGGNVWAFGRPFFVG